MSLFSVVLFWHYDKINKLAELGMCVYKRRSQCHTDNLCGFFPHSFSQASVMHNVLFQVLRFWCDPPALASLYPPLPPRTHLQLLAADTHPRDLHHSFIAAIGLLPIARLWAKSR
jgi:hypothetical protein